MQPEHQRDRRLRAKVRPHPLPPAIGCEGVAVGSGVFSFASYDAMLNHGRV